MIAEQIYKDYRVDRVEDHRADGLGIVLILKPGCYIGQVSVEAVYGDSFKELRGVLNGISKFESPEVNQLAAHYSGLPVRM